MAKNKKVVRYRKPFHLNIGLIVFGIIFVYMMFYFYSYFTSAHVSVYEVIHGTIAVNNSYTGLALRSEEVILSEYAGELNYYRRDASKAGAGDLIYSVDEDGAIARQIHSAGEDVSSLDEESLDELEKKISEYSNGYQPVSFYQIYTFKNELNAQLTGALHTGALHSIADAVTAAEGNATFHKGNAKRDGIVVYYTDGFEEVAPEQITEEMFDESRYNRVNLKEKTKINSGEPVCKLITREDWHLMLSVSDDTRRQLADAATVRVRFKKDGTKETAQCRILEKENRQYLMLTFSNSMIRFANDRYVEVELLFEEETGLKIPNSAITTKDFYTVPMEYFQKGNNSSEQGIMIRQKAGDGRTTDSFVTPNIYFATEYAYYVDGDSIADGVTVLKPDSQETYTIHETAKLEGIYCINKGYAVFRQIDILYQNEEYTIIRSGTEYGISLYDHIALDGSTVTEDLIIQK